MPQNQFDKWLRDKVNPYNSTDGLDQEWSSLQARLKDDEKKRPFLFWIWSGAAVVGLVVILNMMPWTANIEMASADTSSDITTEHQTVENHPAESDRVNDIKSGDSVTPINSKSTTQNKNLSTQKNIIIDRKEVKNADTKKETSIDLNRDSNSSTKSKTIDRSPAPFQLGVTIPTSPMDMAPDRNLKNEILAIPQLISSISWTTQISKSESPKSQFTARSSWHFEIGSSVGQGMSFFSTENDLSTIEAFKRVESAKELVSLDFRAFKGLGKGWWIGSGVNIEYLHIVSQQNFIDTVSATLHNQIVKTREDKDGNRVDIIGTTNGNTIYDIDRKRHQIHSSISIPVTVKYDYTVHRDWFLSGELGFASTIYNYRIGKSIVSNEKDILEMDLNDRYKLGYRGGILAGLSVNRHISDRLSLSFGMYGKKEIIGSTALDETWTQRLSNVSGRLGLRYML